MSEITVDIIGPDDAHGLAPLIAAYVQEMMRGAPRRPDDYYASLLLRDRTAEVLGARLNGELVGFAMFFDLPDAITGLRAGQLELLYVLPDARKGHTARGLMDKLVAIGHQRDWVHLRWLVPEKITADVHIYERLAQPAPWRSYVVPIKG
jgi:GNAT superfamily N-acetyltransferase